MKKRILVVRKGGLWKYIKKNNENKIWNKDNDKKIFIYGKKGVKARWKMLK